MNREASLRAILIATDDVSQSANVLIATQKLSDIERPSAAESARPEPGDEGAVVGSGPTQATGGGVTTTRYASADMCEVLIQ